MQTLNWARGVDWASTVAAVGIVASLLGMWWTHQQRATFDMIDGIYGLCHRLHVELHSEWRLSHLFCIGEETYAEARARVASGVASDDIARLAVRERLFAIQVFIAYEQAFYQWQRSSRLPGHRRRFLREMLDYFVDRLLANPRLRAFLESDRCGCSLHLERESAVYLWTQLPRRPAVAVILVDAAVLRDQVSWGPKQMSGVGNRVAKGSSIMKTARRDFGRSHVRTSCMDGFGCRTIALCSPDDCTRGVSAIVKPYRTLCAARVG